MLGGIKGTHFSYCFWGYPISTISLSWRHLSILSFQGSVKHFAKAAFSSFLSGERISTCFPSPHPVQNPSKPLDCYYARSMLSAFWKPGVSAWNNPKRLWKVTIYESGKSQMLYLHTSHQHCENVALSRCLRYSASRSSEDFDMIFLKLPGQISASPDRGKFSNSNF